MSPASNDHRIRQYEVAKTIDTGKKSGKIIIECSIKTLEGVKVADVAWASDEFISKYGEKHLTTLHQRYAWMKKLNSILTKVLKRYGCAINKEKQYIILMLEKN
ncbi:MAG: hypothetical protein L3J59_03485 [Methylococcaceae bacterium]|nr:hypothetical protein [Methylococcaceae bacterium]